MPIQQGPFLLPIDILKTTVGDKAVELLMSIGQAAAQFQSGAFLVGGVVRDLFLGLPLTDVDIMLEKNAGQFVEFFFHSWVSYVPDFPRPENVRTFPQYGTAKLFFSTEILPGIQLIDFSTARREMYSKPGREPEISFPASLQEDMSRRDFTTNAMAIALSPSNFGELCDFFQGQLDIENKRLNVLHTKSFEDDPARLLRGVRLATRLGFVFGEPSEYLVEKAFLGQMLRTLPPYRLFDEFQKVLTERDVDRVLLELEKRQLLGQIHPAMSLSEPLLQEIKEVTSQAVAGKLEVAGENGQMMVETWEILLGLLFFQISLEKYAEILLEFRLSRKVISRLVEIRELWWKKTVRSKGS